MAVNYTGGCPSIGQLIVTAAIAISTIASPISAFAIQSHHKVQHHIGCNTRLCDKHINRLWSKHHNKIHRLSESSISRFDLCVANRENGEPSSTNYNDINWHAVNGYYGAYSFLHETWVAAGGQRYAYNANEATPAQQSIIFNHWSSIDPGAWPNTIPACE